MKKWILFSTLFLFGCAANHGPSTSQATSPGTSSQEQKEAAMKEESSQNQVVKVKIETTLGDISAELYPQEAPNTVKNFVTLAQKGFYNGIIFHRVIPDFMIQTGDPTGTGMGGPGYQFADEFSPNLHHDKAGMISMANAGPGTNGSQFFITEAPTPWLDNRHTIFGQVTEGIDVVHKIARTERDSRDKPLTPVTMKKVTVQA